MTVFLAKVAYFGGSTYVKGAGTESVSTEGASIGAAYTKDAGIKDTLTCAAGDYIGGVYKTSTYIGSICVDSISAVKRFKIDLPSF